MVTRLLLVLEMVLFTSRLVGQPLCSYVNPFIGTGGSGNTYPNAVAPQGMVSVGIQNHPYWNEPIHFPVSYKYGGATCYGISHTNISGVGCPDRGSIVLLPLQGNAQPARFRSGARVADETASPGVYRFALPDEQVRVSLYAGIHSALHTYSFSAVTDTVSVLLHASRNLSRAEGGQASVVATDAIAGSVVEGLFCGRSAPTLLHYYLQFDQPPLDFCWYDQGRLAPAGARHAAGADIVLVVRFVRTARVRVRIGLSYVSTLQAKRNLLHEVPTWNEQTLYQTTLNQWESLLSRVQITGGSNRDLTLFYTALYHVLLHPNVLSDVDGTYPAAGPTEGSLQDADQKRFTVFSLWDTYRTVHPLLTLLYPEIQQTMVQSMLGIYRESGALPKWEIGGRESYTMVGDPAVIVLADSYVKGVRPADTSYLLQAIIAATDTQRTPLLSRPGYLEQLRYGFIPQDRQPSEQVWGTVSTTLEYAFADWCISVLADSLKRPAMAATFRTRAQLAFNLLDSSLNLFRPRLKNSQWYTPFHPTHDSEELGWAGSGGRGFVEGNAWQYAFFTPHDIPTLISKTGGYAAFEKRLRLVMEKGFFSISNEPDMAYPWLFNYVPNGNRLSRYWVDRIISTQFNATPAGLPGNDDCGTLSAWLVFAMMGIYPDCPGSVIYQTAWPSFSRIKITLNPSFYKSPSCTIERRGTEVFINGKPVGPTVAHDDLTGGVAF